MGSLGSTVVEVGADIGPLNAGLARAKAAVTSFGQTTALRVGGGVGGSLKGAVGAGLGAGAGALGIASGAGLAGIAAGLTKAALKASDLGESLSKVNVTFGGAAKGIIDQADTLATKFGVVKRDALDAAAGFGLMGLAAGLTKDKAAGLGQEFVQLGLDLASYHNISNPEAFEKLRSGLSGEAEPLRALGILLSEDAVKAEALATGIIKVKRELTEAEKVAARASLIKKQAGPAIGDLARTSDSNANQFKKMMGEIENAITDFGQSLQGAMKEGIGLAHDLGKAFSDMAGKGFGEAIGENIRAAIIATRAGITTEVSAEEQAAQRAFNRAPTQENFDTLRQAREERQAKAAGLELEAGPATKEEIQKTTAKYFESIIEESKKTLGDRSGAGAMEGRLKAEGTAITDEHRIAMGRMAQAQGMAPADRSDQQKAEAAQADAEVRMADQRDTAERDRKDAAAKQKEWQASPKNLGKAAGDVVENLMGNLAGLFGNKARSQAAQDRLGMNANPTPGGGLLAGALEFGRNVAKGMADAPENKVKAGEKAIADAADERQRQAALARHSAELLSDPEQYAQKLVMGSLEQRNVAVDAAEEAAKEADVKALEKLHDTEEEAKEHLANIRENIATIAQNIGKPAALIPR